MESCNEASSSTVPKVVIRGGHIIPSIRLTPPDSRPAMSPSVPEQDLGSSSLFVPLRTEEVGWEEGGLIWAAKRYFYPTVNLYGGSDDHVIGTYRGGPKGYRFVNITDKDFALAGSCDDGDVESQKESKTSQNGSKSALPKGPATKHAENSSSSSTPVSSTVSPIEENSIEDSETIEAETPKTDKVRRRSSFSTSSSSSTPSSSRRGSNSTDDEDDDYNSSGADTGLTTPTSEVSRSSGGRKIHSDKDMADELEAALFALQQDDEQEEAQQGEPKKTRLLASRTGVGKICSEPVDASRLAGPIKSQLYNNGLGYDRSLTLSDSIPAAHFQEPRGRSRSRRSLEDEYSAGWSYEQNMEQERLEH